MFVPVPLWVRLAFTAFALAALAFGGWMVIRTVGDVSGATGGYVADSSTGCVYPERYVLLKNAKQANAFVPAGRQVKFPNREAALDAGYRPCQN